MEIGSEFWLEKYNNNNNINNTFELLNFGKDTKLLFSGRVAINYILEEIERKIKIVYMPSYCCESMLIPFLKRGIQVLFYNVYYDNGLKYDIDINRKCDIFFAMNYFGYISTNMNKYIKQFKAKGCIVIEDITHSLLSNIKYSANSDYLVGSLRKWFPILSGGVAISINKKFHTCILKEISKQFIEIKEKAMLQKAKYIELNRQNRTLKQKYIKNYEESNKYFTRYDENYKIDFKSLEILKRINVNEVISKRRQNAEIIYKTLNENIKLLISDINLKDDCPLVVPIIVKERKNLKNYLIKNNIYCPSHWEELKLTEEKSNIYQKELSLICDQRYSKNQIEDYIRLINKYLEEKK